MRNSIVGLAGSKRWFLFSLFMFHSAASVVTASHLRTAAAADMSVNYSSVKFDYSTNSADPPPPATVQYVKEQGSASDNHSNDGDELSSSSSERGITTQLTAGDDVTAVSSSDSTTDDSTTVKESRLFSMGAAEWLWIGLFTM
jgi:hypothetical protein